MVAGIVSVVVMVQMQKKPTKTATASRSTAAPQSRAPQSRAPQSRAVESRAVAAPQTQPAADMPARPAAAPAARPAADTSARTVASLQATPKAQPEAKTVPSAKSLSDAERKLSEELWAEQKRLDTDSAKLVAKPDGRRRVTAMIAKQYNVPEKVVSDLHDQKVSYGEISASLAFSQQLVKRDKSTRQAALDRVRAARKSGQGWAAFAKATGLKIGDVLDDVRKTDKQLAKAIG